MATKGKTSTMDKVTKKVKKAAKNVAKTADEYVVEPVGKALGLIKKSPKRSVAGKKTSSSKKKAVARSR